MDMVKRAMQNGLLFIEDIVGGRSPFPATDAKIQFTSSCISVACLHEIDGDAELTIGQAGEVAPGYAPKFDGQLETPSREIAISNVPGEVLLKSRVPEVVTRVRVWWSHPEWAEQVFVGLG